MNPLYDELVALLNRYNAENKSNTPDYILAMFMLDSLKAFERATIERDRWYGHTPWANLEEPHPAPTLTVVDTPPTEADLDYYPDRTTP